MRLIPIRRTLEREAFEALDVNEQTWRFLNWQSRLVHPHGRQINKALGFDQLPAVKARNQSVEMLISSIEKGEDVTGYLSRDVLRGYCLRPDGRKDGPDFDLLLNEWGIHHLHLDPAPGKGGFRARTKDLLYVIFERRVAYVIAVAPHGSWTDSQLIQATVRSWPASGLFRPLHARLEGGISEDDHLLLRKAGVATIASADNQCWISGLTGGLTTALVSYAVSREAQKLIRIVLQATKDPAKIYGQFKDGALLNGISWPMYPEISIRGISTEDQFRFSFWETNTGLNILI